MAIKDEAEVWSEEAGCYLIFPKAMKGTFCAASMRTTLNDPDLNMAEIAHAE